MQVEKTVVFIDVCDSSMLFETLGDQRARRLIRTVLEDLAAATHSAGGRVVKSLGDGLLSYFPTVDAAVGYSVRAYRTSVDSPDGYEIRIGLVDGVVLEEDDDVFGDVVNVASRLCGLAGKGQIFSTRETLYRAQLPRDVMARSLGSRQVKGRTEPIEIVQLVTMDTVAETTFLHSPFVERRRHQILSLSFGRQGLELSTRVKDDRVQLGRSDQNDMQVEHTGVSRQHATVLCRNHRFYLLDHSTNGTFVVPENGPPVLIEREEYLLTGNGRIGLGSEVDQDPHAAVSFRVREES